MAIQECSLIEMLGGPSMGEISDLLPGATEIRAQLTELHRLHATFLRRGMIIREGSVDVTQREVAHLGAVIRDLEKALGFRITGIRD
jgi:hypothetical protein